MATRQGASLDRRKLMGDPIMVSTIVVLIAFLTLFILYPLAVLLVDSVYGAEGGLTLDIFKRIFAMHTFRTAISNTLKIGFAVGIFSTIIGLLFAYVEVYVKVRTKFMGALFKTWGYDFGLTTKWFVRVFEKYKGFKAFRDSFSCRWSPPCGRSTRVSRNPPTTWAQTASRSL